MRATMLVCIGLCACGANPDYITGSGVLVYDRVGLVDPGELVAVMDMTIEIALTFDPKLTRSSAYPDEIHIQTDVSECYCYCDAKAVGCRMLGCYTAYEHSDSILVLWEPGLCWQETLAHELAHRFQHATGRLVDHEAPYFKDDSWGYRLEYEANFAFCR